MAEVVCLTDGLVKVTSTSDSQPLYTAVDVLAFDALDLLISASFEPSGSPSLDLLLLTSAQRVSTDGWKSVSLSPAVRGTPPLQNGKWTIAGGFLRYVRWQVNSLTGATAARFRIDGVGRRKGC